MGVYIKGMEMPKNCFECPWRCKVDPENLLCRISGEYFEETFSGTIQNRHKSCPLVPVPPHMSAAIEKVISERERQIELWGECSDNHPFEWMSILGEEFGELCEAVNETYFKNGAHPEYGGNEKIIKEAVHVAAVAVAIIESAIRAGEE